MKILKGKMLENYDVNTNIFNYLKGQTIDVVDFGSFKDNYGVYHNLVQGNCIDWVPKKIIEII